MASHTSPQSSPPAASDADPAATEAQALAEESIRLLEEFTRRDPEVEAGLQKWWQGYSALPADQKPFPLVLTDEETAFLERAKAIYRERQQG